MAIDQSVLKHVFTEARTFNTFTDQPVSRETLAELYELLRWGPTSMNSQPGRYLFLCS